MIKDFITNTVGKLIRGLDRFTFPSFYWTWDGKGTFTQGSPDEIESEESIERYYQISRSPLCFSGVRFRDISRLWISATPFEDERTGFYHRGQIFPPSDPTVDPEVTDFVRWVFDEAFENKGMQQVLSQMSNALIIYGRTVQGLNWVKGDTPFGERVYVDDILDMNPGFFLKDPDGYPEGTYLKGTIYTSNNLVRLPDNLTMWGTKHMYFENPYGISEMGILNLIEKYWRKNMLFWAKGNERNGSGAYVGKYGNRLFGKDRESERQTFLEELQKLKNDTITITHLENEIAALQGSIENDSLQGFHEACGQIISIVLTGSVTALQEGRVGGFSKEEATTTRRKSELEISDASSIENIFNYNLIPPLVDYNYDGVTSYPWMQIIQPELIVPTTPKDQDTSQEVEDNDNDEKEGNDKKNEKSEEEFRREFITVTTFQEQLDLPDSVIKNAKKIAGKLPVYVKKDFDKLSEKNKRESFTITSIGENQKSLGRIAALRDLIADTIDITDEKKAWKEYFQAAKAYLEEDEINAVKEDLFISFRYARQTAYNRAIDDAIEKDKDLYAIQILTQDDTGVRPDHVPWHGVIRPVDDPIWNKVHLPFDFGCRCVKHVITREMFKKNPEKYKLTPRDKIPPIPKGFET
jgi:hypothetical protein